MGIDKKQEVHTHKIGVYLWIWGLLFVFSFFSYMVDYINYQGLLRWSLIVFFMLVKAGLIMAIFMHLYWERWAIVNVLLWPMTAIGVIFLFIFSRKVFRGDFDTGKRGYFTSMKSDYEAIEILGLYWHFVDLVWVFIFAFFYLW